MNIALRSAVEQRDLLARGELSAVDLLEACLGQYDKHNAALNAVIYTQLDQARKDATAADEAWADGRTLGPLHGLVMTVKDSIDWAGAPSTWGDPLTADYFPEEDAEVVSQLRAAGAVVYGKTNVPKHLGDWQSHNTIYGRTNNPWNLARTPGGSSGGSAVSVATGMASIEMGSDIGGSVRWPANYNGVAGLKTSFGLVSQHGHSYRGHEGIVDNNVVGPIARTVADLSLMLPTMWHPHMCPPSTSKTSLAEFTVGVMLENPVGKQDAAMTAGVEAAIAQLVSAGVSLADPPPQSVVLAGHHAGMELGRAAASGPEPLPTQEEIARYDNGARDYDALVAHGSRLTYRQWIDLNNERERARLGWRDYFQSVDLLLTPVTPTTAPPHDTDRSFSSQTVVVNGEDRPIFEQWFWAALANATYLPALSIPAGIAEDGLPFAIQAIGPYMGCLLYTSPSPRDRG